MECSSATVMICSHILLNKWRKATQYWRSRPSSRLCRSQHQETPWWYLWVHSTCSHQCNNWWCRHWEFTYETCPCKSITSTACIDGKFNYRSVIGKLNYLGQTLRSDIVYAGHQVAKYSSDPRKEHKEAIIYIIKYLKATTHIRLCFKPDPMKGFQSYCDADFAGNWNKQFAATDFSIAKSRSGWIIFYAGCPIIWASKLQSSIVLLAMDTEYISMSMALRDVIPLMELINKMRDQKFDVKYQHP